MTKSKSIHPPLDLDWEAMPKKPSNSPPRDRSERDKLLDKLRKREAYKKAKNPV